MGSAGRASHHYSTGGLGSGGDRSAGGDDSTRADCMGEDNFSPEADKSSSSENDADAKYVVNVTTDTWVGRCGPDPVEDKIPSFCYPVQDIFFVTLICFSLHIRNIFLFITDIIHVELKKKMFVPQMQTMHHQRLHSC